MASRRDQLQSYQFLTQRMISAFVMRETDPAQSPLRRGVGAVFVGLMVAVMVGAGFGVAGIITKTGSANWKSDGAVVVEKETGASYLYHDGVLHPMLNYSSALLAAAKPAGVFHVAGNSLAGTPRGNVLGIPGAPDALPARKLLLGQPWSMCTTGTGGKATMVTLLVGHAPAGGRSLGGDGLLVTDTGNGNVYLVTGGRRYQIQQPSHLVSGLFGGTAATPVGRAWLNGLPAGSDIAPIPVGADKGKPSTVVTGFHVGDLVTAQTGTVKQYWMVFDDGLAPLNHLQWSTYQAQADAANGGAALDIPLNRATNAPVSAHLKAQTGVGAPPSAPPTLIPTDPTTTVCAVTHDARTPPDVVIGGAVDAAGPGTATGLVGDAGAALADRVVVPGGRIAVVRAVDGPASSGNGYVLVTDVGVRYGVPDDTSLQLLGYQPDDAVNVPSNMVLRIPAGPELDTEHAIRAVRPSGTTN